MNNRNKLHRATKSYTRITSNMLSTPENWRNSMRSFYTNLLQKQCKQEGEMDDLQGKLNEIYSQQNSTAMAILDELTQWIDMEVWSHYEHDRLDFDDLVDKIDALQEHIEWWRDRLTSLVGVD